jgi:peroxiredoxin
MTAPFASFRSAVSRTAAILALTAAPAAAQDSGIPIGEQAPGGPLQTLAGQTVDLAMFLGKQQPTVIEFWATWCPSCKQLDPAMRAAHAKYGKQVRFVTVAVSVNQSLQRVKAWQAANKLPGELLYDQKGTVSGAYDVPATSYVVIADKSGKVVYTGVGGTQNIDAAIKKAM